MRTSMISGLLLATLLMAVPSPEPAGGGVPRPPGELRVDDRGYEGQFDVYTGSVRLRCRVGLIAESVTVTFSQAGSTSPAVDVAPVPCDGAWHRLGYTSYPGYYPGLVQVRARMALADAATGAPRGAVVSTRDVYVRPGAKVILPATAELGPDGTLRFSVQGRCDEPWILQDFGVSASQRQGFVFATAQLEIPCDGTFHTHTAELIPVGRPFERGWVSLRGGISTLDGENFDPAVGASAARGARVG